MEKISLSVKGGRVIGRMSRQTDDIGAIKQRAEVDAIKEEGKKAKENEKAKENDRTFLFIKIMK